jgi:hypothetical protein
VRRGLLAGVLSNAFAVTNQWIGDFAGNPRPLSRTIAGLAVISGLGRGELFAAPRQQDFPRQLVCVGLYLPELGELL